MLLRHEIFKNKFWAFYRGWFIVVHLCSNFSLCHQMAPLQSIKFLNSILLSTNCGEREELRDLESVIYRLVGSSQCFFSSVLTPVCMSTYYPPSAHLAHIKFQTADFFDFLRSYYFDLLNNTTHTYTHTFIVSPTTHSLLWLAMEVHTLGRCYGWPRCRLCLEASGLH